MTGINTSHTDKIIMRIAFTGAVVLVLGMIAAAMFVGGGLITIGPKCDGTDQSGLACSE